MAELDDLINENTAIDPEKRKKVPKTRLQDERKYTKKQIRQKGEELVVDAAARAADKVYKQVGNYPSKAVAEAFRHFEEAAQGKHSLKRTLQFTPEANTAFKLIQRLLRDENFINDPDTHALFGACRRHGITLASLVLAFKDAKVAEMSLAALTRLAQDSPIVLDQISEDAQNKFDQCHVCEGSGRIQQMNDQGEWAVGPDGCPQTRLCLHCRGTGKQWKPHDPASRKQFLQITGILEEGRSKGGININTGTQQIAVIKQDFLPGDGSFEKLIRAIDTVTSPKRLEEGDIIDVVPEIAVYEEEPNSPA